MTEAIIREAREEELDRLVNIWLEGSMEAHNFIESAYWEENKDAMRGLYLPLAENVVAEEEGTVVGFISMMGDYLAAIFVDPGSHQKGIGQKLLQHVKAGREKIHLKVYAKNESAILFYERNGFHVTGTSRDEATGEEEWLMEWNKMDGEV